MRDSISWWAGLCDWERLQILERIVDLSPLNSSQTKIAQILIQKFEGPEEFSADDIKTVEMLSIEL